MTRRPRLGARARQEALARAFPDGDDGPGAGSVEQVARELGVAPSTLYRWRSRTAAAPDAAADDTADRLVAACQELLARQSYGELSVEEVARAAGVSPRTAYNHHPRKEDLVAAAVADAAARLRARMVDDVAAAAADLAPLDAVTAILVSGLRAAADIPQSVLLFRDLGLPPGSDAAEHWHARLVDVVAALLDRAVETGEVPAGDTRGRAAVVVAAARAVNALRLQGVPLPVLESATRRIRDLAC